MNDSTSMQVRKLNCYLFNEIIQVVHNKLWKNTFLVSFWVGLVKRFQLAVYVYRGAFWSEAVEKINACGVITWNYAHILNILSKVIFVFLQYQKDKRLSTKILRCGVHFDLANCLKCCILVREFLKFAQVELYIIIATIL